jgi:hypothetical protein
MLLSTTVMNCGVTYLGHDPVAKVPTPYPRLRSVFNRGWWLEWATVAQPDGSLDWTLADAWVAGCEAQGVQPLAVLGSYPQRKGVDIDGAADFAALAAKRYAGRVRHWQTGNEADAEESTLFDGYSGELAGRVHRAMETAIHRVDPGAVVIAPSVQSIWLTGHGLQTLRGIVQGYGGLPPHVSVHVYTGKRTTADITPALHRVWGALEAFGKTGDVPVHLWGTEVGVTGFSGMPEAEQIKWLRAAIRACRAGGMHSFHHYNLDHGAQPGDYGFPRPSAALWNRASRT